MANNSNQSLYEILQREPARAGLFANSMKVFSGSPEYGPEYIADFYDWKALGRAKVVDIGGSQGHIAMELLKRFDNLNIVVQDIPEVVKDAEVNIPDNLKGRLTFMPHNFFQPQSVKADVYYFRWILHNWSDKYCMLLLRAQIPVLDRGAHIIVQDSILPEPGTIPLWREQDVRCVEVTFVDSSERITNSDFFQVK